MTNKEIIIKHAKSFLKTYVSAFLAIMFFADSQGQDVFAVAFALPAAKASLITALRNVYKFVTEDVPEIRER